MELNMTSLTSLYTGWSSIFSGAFEDYEASWPKIAMHVPSSTRENAYPWLGHLGGMREWIGSRVVGNLTRYGFAIENRHFENTVAIDRNDIEDDQIGVYAPLFADLGQTAAELPDVLVWDLLSKGFTAEGYDGRPFFDEAHPVLDGRGGETQASNFTDGAGPAWFLFDTSRQIKPFIYQERTPPKLIRKDSETDETVFAQRQFLYGVDMRCNAGYGLWQLAYASKADLTPESYASARAAMLGMKGDGGRALRLRPNLMVVPPELEGAARSLLNAERNVDGSSNIYAGTAELLVEPLLT